MRTQKIEPRWKLFAALAASVALAGCGPMSDADLAASGSALADTNGMSLNGMSMNGMSMNGMSMNGMSMNGLSITYPVSKLPQNGLTQKGVSTVDFRNWFNADPASADTVMTYVVKCALARGKSLTYKPPSSTTTWTWAGNLGLAPAWTSGQPIPLAEQQLVTACFGAHANKFGRTVNISVRGFQSDGATQIPLDPGEDAAYTQNEACWFGNMFQDQGFFVALDRGTLATDTTNPRGCAIYAGVNGDCPPLQNVGTCQKLCTAGTTTSDKIWLDCLWNGVHYRSIQTRLQPSDVYVCGDGTCQFTESCGTTLTSSTYDSCGLDCGLCATSATTATTTSTK